MINTKSIDLLNIIPGQFKKVANTKGGEYHGACPFCGTGTDRFRIQPHRDNPRWECRKCGANGDAIAFMMQYHNLNFVEAVERLNLDSQLQKQNQSGSQIRSQVSQNQNIAPGPDYVHALDNPEWQDKAAKFVEWSWRNLHCGDYPDVNEYLTNRGVEHYDSDIWKLGYNPKNFNRNWGGKDVFLPTGIVIPWLDRDESVRKINVRRFEPNKSKYLQVSGGANWLFNAHKIKADSIVVLVEGELDAISIAIGCDYFHQVVPVASGSNTGARWLRWAALLASAHKVLIAFDDDHAGEAATNWWAEYLPHNSRRLLPEMKDANEMLINRYPFKLWIEKGLS